MTEREPYVEIRTIQYTELVFFDADGAEVGREERMDHICYDSETRPMTDEDYEGKTDDRA